MLNSSRTSRPEMTFANDSLVGGVDIVAGLTLAITITDGCLDARIHLVVAGDKLIWTG
jgi:hypothetical protein